MDITKVLASIKASKTEVQNLINASVTAKEFRSLSEVVKAGEQLDRAIERIESAKEKSVPKVKEPKVKEPKK